METQAAAKQQLKRIPWIPIAAFIAILVIILVAVSIGRTNSRPKEEIITQSVLEEVINVSNLSTFEAVYNGIAQVMNEKKTEKIDYYVSYEAKIKAGFDFDKIKISLDNETKRITVTIPPIEITDVNVDITSLDYIFVNDKANTETVSQAAYKACIADATTESQSKSAIYHLAEQNAKNIVEALIKPFVKQLDSAYVLEIEVEGRA